MAEYKCKNYINKYKCDYYNENHTNCEKCELAIKPVVDVELVEELMEQSKELCSSILDGPYGCEACWLLPEQYSEIENDDEWFCPLEETLNKIKEQIKKEEKDL